MSNSWRWLILVLLLSPGVVAQSADSTAQPSSRVSLPQRWIHNAGQWDPRVSYATSSNGFVVQAERGALRFAVPTRHGVETLRLVFSEAPVPRGTGLREEPCHVFVGSTEQRWRRSVQAFEAVEYSTAPGVTAAVVPTRAGLALSIRAENAAALRAMSLKVEGAMPVPEATSMRASIAFAGGASLGMRVIASDERHPAGGVREVACRLVSSEGSRFRLEVDPDDVTSEIHVSLAIEWSTLFGGGGAEHIQALALDRSGGTVIAGYTTSLDLPVTDGAFDTEFGGGGGTFPRDIFVARFAETGRLLWATYLGGQGSEDVVGIHVRPDGAIVLGGHTTSQDFPTTPGSFEPTDLFFLSGFVCILSAAGEELESSTYLGGNGIDWAEGFAVDHAGSPVLVGYTDSTDFPVTPNAIQGQGGGAESIGFVARMNPDLSELTFSTYFGFDHGAQVRAATSGPDGHLVIAGAANSSLMEATPGAFYAGEGGFEVFVATLDPDAGQLLALTYVGIDHGLPAIAGLGVDGHDRIVLTGTSGSPGPFPLGAPGFDGTHNGSSDPYVAKFDRRLSTLLYGTFIGSAGNEAAWASQVERSGAVTLVGAFGAAFGQFPTTPGALQTTSPGGDALVVRLSPDGTRLDYATYLGGTFNDFIEQRGAVALGSLGEVTVGGLTTSDDFPLSGAIDTELSGAGAAFVTRLSMLPDGVVRYGSPSQLDGQLPYLGVSAMPAIGADVAITCTEAPDSSIGLLLLSRHAMEMPLSVGQADLWVDPVGLIVILPLKSDVAGYGETALRLPTDPAAIGLEVFAQVVWPRPFGEHGASNALSIELQP